jgi:pimeloyl-ACP methyl ester carboxylesterase
VVLFLLFLFAPFCAHASVISEHTGIQGPFLRPTGDTLDINTAPYFVAPGALSDILIAPVSNIGFTGSETFSLQLYSTGANGARIALDCTTPTKSVTDWGITTIANDPNAPMVDFGPFTGTQCYIPAATSATTTITAELYSSSGVGNGIGWDWNPSGFNFIVSANDAPATAQGSSVLFLPGTEASRLYMKTATGEDQQLWEPTLLSNISALAVNADGSSVNTVFTKDIVGSIYGNTPLVGAAVAQLDQQDLGVYSGFEQFMDALVAGGTIREWRAYPYDWRYDPFAVITKGTLTEMPDGSLQRIYLEDVVKTMAADSPTGKVTIIGHSSGGLLAEALAETMGDSASQYIDRIILVGTPQLGTPSAIGALLHADNFSDIPNLIVNSKQARATSSTMPGVYELLPSAAYFASILDPVVTFDASGTLSGAYAHAFGTAIDSVNTLGAFLTDGTGLDEQSGPISDLRTPFALSPSLLQGARESEDTLAAWVPPNGLTVTAIAGWGQLTTKTLAYTTKTTNVCTRPNPFSPAVCKPSSQLAHTSVTTSGGDDTVLATSATGDDSALYLNLKSYRAAGNGNFTHQNLPSAKPIEDAISDLLKGLDPATEPYLSEVEPSGGTRPLVIVSSHSPVNLTATDSSGDLTGVIPIPGTDFAIREEGVPDSSVIVDDDEEYLYLPQDGSYQIVATGYSSGTTELDVANVNDDGSDSTTAAFSNIPTTDSTTMTFSLDSGAASAPLVDLGDGSSPFAVGSDTPATFNPVQTVALLQTQFQSLVVRPGIKNRLLRALVPLQADTTDQSAIANLESLIEAQAGVGLSLDESAALIQLLDSLKQS